MAAFSYAVAFSQDPKYKFSHLGESDGLPSPNVQCIYRDSLGFVWFGTESGICKYDGHSLVIYTEDFSDTTRLAGNYIRAIAGASNTNLWIGTTRGLCLYKREMNNFKSYLPEPGNPESISSIAVFSIAREPNGNLWIATNDSGLNYFDVKAQKFKRFFANQPSGNSLSYNTLTRVYLDSNGRLWIGTIQGVVDLYSPQSGKFQKVLLPLSTDRGFNRDQIRDIISDKNGNVWVGTSGSGVFRITISENDTIIDQITQYTDKAISISNNYVSCLEVDKAGNLLVGMENGGLNYIDFKSGKTYRYTADVFNNQSLSHISVWDIHSDYESNLWVSSYSKGVDVSFNEDFGFRHYFNIPNDNTSLGFNTVSCFTEDSKGNLWIGTDGGGLDLFDREKGTFKHYNTQNSSIPSNAVIALAEDSKGTLWVGTWSGGLSYFDYSTEKFSTYTSQNSGLSCNNIISIYEDKSGLIWAGTFWCEGGINTFDREKLLFKNYTIDKFDISDNTIFCAMEDSYGLLWIGTNNGLTYYNRATGKFGYYRTIEDDSSTLSQVTIMNLLETHDSILWVGSANGLNRFNRAKGTFTRYYVEDGLPNNYIAGMEEDGQGNIWIATQDGISKFNPKTNSFTNYKPSVGLQGKQFYRCSHYKSADGTIFFGGTNGFNFFKPDEVKDIKLTPKMFFTNFYIFNQPATIGGEGAPIQKHISVAEKVMLSYRHKSFTFEFTAINLNSPKETHFAYKLEGFDNDWVYVGTQRSATYTNINPGKYTFRVKVPYHSGIENEEGIFIELVIKPPFWQTWWFRVISALFVTFSLLGIYAYRVRAIRTMNIQLSKLVEERTYELQQMNDLLKEQAEELNETNALLEERQQLIEENTEELMAQKEELMAQKEALEQSNATLHEVNATKDKFFSIIAHDIKNPFNTILGFTDLLKVKYDDWTDEKRKQMIDIVSESAENIFALLENLLQWSRSQRGIIEFHPEKIALKKLIENVITIICQGASEKNIQIVTRLESEQIEAYADRHMLDTMLRNLISNAIKFTNNGGEIVITAQTKGDSVEISVADNGVGMSKDSIAKLFRIDSSFSSPGTNKEKGTGLGLILVNEFVSQHNGSIHVDSETGKGSTFTIRLPLPGHW
ncbi:MAG: hypothetical protein JXB34_09150 [Bacteroidales bacterium]|nr:hypothetical protein [Bacteroidales bacterium]